MDNKKPLIAAVAGVVIVVIVAIIAVSVRQPGTGGGGKETAAPAAAGTQLPMGASTRGAVPANAVVPDAHATSVPANVAVPTFVAPANPGNTASFRSYDIRVEGGKFIPDTIVVDQWDTVKINFTAVDRDYDFTQTDYGFRIPIPKGTSKVVEFSATGQGNFLFSCTQCGGPERGPQGHLIVTDPKKR